MADEVEVRTLTDALRAQMADGRPTKLAGHAIKTNVRSGDLGGFVEVVAPEAITAALQRNSDLVALVNHNTDRVLGRVSAKTLAVEHDAAGLRFEVEPPAHEAGLVESIARGDLPGASFAFHTRRDAWDERTSPPTRTLLDIDVREISLGVAFPAYADTHVIALRSLQRHKESVMAEPVTAPPVVELVEPVPPIPPTVSDEHRHIEVVGAERVLTPGDSVRAWTERARPRDEYARLSFGALLRAMVCGPRTDIERRALAEGSDSTGGVTVPDIVSASFIDRLRAQTVCVRAGARTIPLSSDKTTIARLASDVTASWRLENAEITPADPTFEGVVFIPRSLAALVRVSRELLEDSLNIEEMLQRSFASAFAVEVDRVALRGSGTPPEPRGIINTAGINSVAGGGALTSYDKALDAVAAILGDNAPVPTAAVMSPAIYVSLAKLKESTTASPLARPPIISDMTFYPTTAMPDTTVVLGGFEALLLGIRSSLRVEVLRERYGEFLQYGFLGHLRMDVALEHPEAFAQITAVAP